MTGGYQIIDLKNKDIAIDGDSAVVIAGIYDAIEGTRKATLLTNLVVDSTELHDRYVELDVSGDDYVGYIVIAAATYKITVTDDDEVTITTIS